MFSTSRSLADSFVDKGEVAYAALTGIEQLLEKYGLKLTADSEEGTWSALYEAVQCVEVADA